MGSASEQPPFPENSRRAGTEDSLLKPAMERRASFGRLRTGSASLVEAASRRLGVFKKRPGAASTLASREFRPQGLNFLLISMVFTLSG